MVENQQLRDQMDATLKAGSDDMIVLEEMNQQQQVVILNLSERVAYLEEVIRKKGSSLGNVQSSKQNPFESSCVQPVQVENPFEHVKYKDPNATESTSSIDSDFDYKNDGKFYNSLLGKWISNHINSWIDSLPLGIFAPRKRSMKRLFLAYVIALHLLLMYVFLKVK